MTAAVVVLVVVVVEVGSRGGNRVEEVGGWVGVLEWKNTISPALLQCLSSQLVTLKHQS